jgi:RecG-like helicase
MKYQEFSNFNKLRPGDKQAMTYLYASAMNEQIYHRVEKRVREGMNISEACQDLADNEYYDLDADAVRNRYNEYKKELSEVDRGDE